MTKGETVFSPTGVRFAVARPYDRFIAGEIADLRRTYRYDFKEI